MLNTKGLTMPEARYRAPDGSITKVQLPNTKLQSGAVHYDEKTHKGNLICKCCDAPVHIRISKVATIAGDNFKSPRTHFASNRRDNHSDECTVDLAIPYEGDSRNLDLTKGYMFRLNTGVLREQFGGKSRPYGRRTHPHHKILINPEFADREGYGANSTDDLQRLIGRKKDQRVREAIVINGGDVIEMKDFFFRPTYKKDGKTLASKQPRLKHLVDQLQAYGDDQRILLEVNLDKPKYSKGKYFAAEGKAIRLFKDRDKDGYAFYLVPRLCVSPNNRQAAAAALQMNETGKYLAMGICRMKVKKDEESKTINYVVDVLVDLGWVSKVKLDQDDRMPRQRKQQAPFQTKLEL